MQNTHKKKLLPLFLLIVISLMPAMGGWFLFFYHGKAPLKTVNHGVLINPPLHVFNVSKQWQVIFMPGECCDTACEKKMFTLHQLRKALGKDSQRVKLVLASKPTCKLKPLRDFQKISTQWLDTAHQQGKINFPIANKIYLVDPIGNLFMYYSGDTDPMDILKDLKKVLEVSQIG